MNYYCNIIHFKKFKYQIMKYKLILLSLLTSLCINYSFAQNSFCQGVFFTNATPNYSDGVVSSVSFRVRAAYDVTGTDNCYAYPGTITQNTWNGERFIWIQALNYSPFTWADWVIYDSEMNTITPDNFYNGGSWNYWLEFTWDDIPMEFFVNQNAVYSSNYDCSAWAGYDHNHPNACEDVLNLDMRPQFNSPSGGGPFEATSQLTDNTIELTLTEEYNGNVQPVMDQTLSANTWTYWDVKSEKIYNDSNWHKLHNNNTSWVEGRVFNVQDENGNTNLGPEFELPANDYQIRYRQVTSTKSFQRIFNPVANITTNSLPTPTLTVTDNNLYVALAFNSQCTESLKGTNAVNFKLDRRPQQDGDEGWLEIYNTNQLSPNTPPYVFLNNYNNGNTIEFNDYIHTEFRDYDTKPGEIYEYRIKTFVNDVDESAVFQEQEIDDSPYSSTISGKKNDFSFNNMSVTASNSECGEVVLTFNTAVLDEMIQQNYYSVVGNSWMSIYKDIPSGQNINSQTPIKEHPLVQNQYLTNYYDTDIGTGSSHEYQLAIKAEFNDGEYYNQHNRTYSSYVPLIINGVSASAAGKVTVTLEHINPPNSMKIKFSDLTPDNTDSIKIFRNVYNATLQTIGDPEELIINDSNQSGVDISNIFGTTSWPDDIGILYNEEYYEWIDTVSQLNQCETYQYYIETINKCDDITTSEAQAIVINDLEESVIIAENLSASKGDTKNHIHLDWHSSTALATSYSINRRPLGEMEYINIGSVPISTSDFDDLYANANTLYEYNISADCECSTTSESSSSSFEFPIVTASIIGFRVPHSSISGSISFNNGDPVENIDVIVYPNNSNDEFRNRSLSFQAQASKVHISKLNLHRSEDKFAQTIAFWAKSQPGVIDQNRCLTTVTNNDSDTTFFDLPFDDLNWHYYTLVFGDTSSISLYIDGILNDLSFTIAGFDGFKSTDHIYIGNLELDKFKGAVDEISIWSTALSSEEIKFNSNKYLISNNADLLGYYHCDEGVGSNIYDSSNNNNVYRIDNNLLLESVEFSEIAPEENFINHSALTDQNGFYHVKEIRYNDDGNIFSIVPQTTDTAIFSTPHQFQPNTSIQYLGDQAEYIPNLNFIDISSFNVNGTINYQIHSDMTGTGAVNYSIAVEGVKVLIDGIEKNDENGQQIVTNADGEFTIAVPVGEHTITFEKDGLEFQQTSKNENSEFTFSNVNEKYNFQSDINLDDFVDIECTSKKSLIVRVTGGLAQEGTPLGFAADTVSIESDQINTIGQSSFYLVPLGGNSNSPHIIYVETGVYSGEDSVYVLPIEYQIIDFNCTNSDVEQKYDNSYVFPIIDAQIRDSSVGNDEFNEDILSFVDGDTTKKFHHKYELIYRSNPVIMVSNQGPTGENGIIGKTSVLVQVDELTIPFNLIDDNNGYVLDHPVFQKYEPCTLSVKVVEEYIYHSTNNITQTFTIPVTKGVIQVNNEMLYDSTLDTLVVDTEWLYIFTPDNPNVFGFESGFLRNLVFDYQDENLYNTWSKPVLLFGEKGYGNSFYTNGPQEVEFILRDPGGDGSYSWIQHNSSYAYTRSAFKESSVVDGIKTKIGLGLEFELGIFGFALETKLTSSWIMDTKNSRSLTSGESLKFERNFTSSIQTPSNRLDGYHSPIGEQADLYIGHASNIGYQTTKSIEIIKKENCDNNPDINCLDKPLWIANYEEPPTEYRIGNNLSFAIVPLDGTDFAYTGNYIENYIIPGLEMIRNAEFVGGVYTSLLTFEDDCYGLNNNDPCFDTVNGPSQSYTMGSTNLDELGTLINNSNNTENSLTSNLEYLYTEYIENFVPTGLGIEGSVNYLEPIDGIGEPGEVGLLVGASNELIGGYIPGVIDLATLIMQATESDPCINNIPTLSTFTESNTDLEANGCFNADNVHPPADLIQYYNQQIHKWKLALAQNEYNKYRSNTTDVNHSFSAGFVQSYTQTDVFNFNRSYKTLYQLNIINNNETTISAAGVPGFNSTVGITYIEEEIENNQFELENHITTGYTLNDDDEGDVISINVNSSPDTTNTSFGLSFETVAGATSCPHEPGNEYRFINDAILFKEVNYHYAYQTAINEFMAANPLDVTADLDLSGGWFNLVDNLSSIIDDLSEPTPPPHWSVAGFSNVQIDAITSSANAKNDLAWATFNALINTNNTNNIYSQNTSQREVPKLTIEPYNLSNVPEQEPGVFTLTLKNESEDNSTYIFNLKVLESSNPYGAILKIDGSDVNRDFVVPFGEELIKTLTVEKGPEEINYDDLSIIIHSQCQYEQGSSDNIDIADTVTFSIHYLPTCTNIDVNNIDDGWIVNTDNQILEGGSIKTYMELAYTNYNANYYSLKYLEFQYRPNNGQWITISDLKHTNPNYVLKEEDFPLLNVETLQLLFSESFNPEDPLNWYNLLQPSNPDDSEYNSTAPSTWVTETRAALMDEYSPLIAHDSYKTDFTWQLPPLDGEYQLRVKSNCGEYTSALYSSPIPVDVFSDQYSGIVDRIRPQKFGSPEPQDGILEPNDDVKVTFNEAINEYSFNSSGSDGPDISVKAIKNGGEINHNAFLSFDGTQNLQISRGLNLTSKSFTIEAWVKLTDTSLSENCILFSQSESDGSQQLNLKIVNSNLVLEFVDALGNTTSATSSSVLADSWNHIAVTFDIDNFEVNFIINGTASVSDIGTLNFDNTSLGPVTIGSQFNGSIHELRVWNGIKFAPTIYANMYVNYSGNEPNLLVYLPMTELSGKPIDRARSRNITTTAQWAVSESGKAYSFDGANYLEKSNFVGATYESTHDFTIECWIKANGTQCNGKTFFTNNSSSDDLDVSDIPSNPNGWSIGLNNAGKIVVKSNSVELTSDSIISYNKWCHVALVRNANSNTTLYLDNVEVGSIPSQQMKGFSGALLRFGANQSINPSNFWYGNIDEVRIWGLAKTLDQIKSESSNSLEGNEIGLDTYYSFEGVEDIVALGSNGDTINFNSYLEEDNVPLISLSSMKTNVAFNKISNGDQVLIELTEAMANIENCIVDVTIDNVYDLFNNVIEEPITWSFFNDMNQLEWEHVNIEKSKLLGESLVFNTHIINHGGTVEQFDISNLPTWLSANPSEGVLEPNSIIDIEFVVNDMLFIGDYQVDISLTGSNNYPERLELSVSVDALEPTYEFNSNAYSNSMNFIGKLLVDGSRSRDEDDIIFAYVEDEIRGVCKPVYIDEYDAYFVFLTVYSNSDTQEEAVDIKFRMWDASEGKMQASVKMNNLDSTPFLNNEIMGSFTNLTVFSATNILRQEIILNQGWNWISFNLNSIIEDDGLDDILKIPTVMNEVDGSSVLILKNQYAFTNYLETETATQWVGGLGEIPVTDMYMMKMASVDTIGYEGKMISTTETAITINEGWTWISYLGQRILGVNQAMSSLNPIEGDIIKSKTSFSMYASESIGWLGTLNNMESGVGYMIKTANDGELVYPQSSMYGANNFRLNNNIHPNDYWPVKHGIYENTMNVVASIEIPSYIEENEENLLGAFNELFCVGNVSGISVQNNNLLYFITLFGNNGDQINFDYLDIENNKIYSTKNSLEFNSNSIIGTINDPYPIVITPNQQTIESSFEMSVTPNPFNEDYTVEYFIDNSSNVQLSLYDVLGRHIYTLPMTYNQKGNHSIKLDSKELGKGMYFIQLRIEDQVHRKIIIKS